MQASRQCVGTGAAAVVLGTNDLSENVRSITPAWDGGYIAAGNRTTQGFLGSSIFVQKIHEDGSLGWEQTYQSSFETGVNKIIKSNQD